MALKAKQKSRYLFPVCPKTTDLCKRSKMEKCIYPCATGKEIEVSIPEVFYFLSVSPPLCYSIM